MWRTSTLALCLLSLMPQTCLSNCRYTIGYNDEPIPPYIERNQPSSGPLGSAFTLVNNAAKRLGCQIRWQYLPNLRVLHDASLGSIDGAIFYAWTPEREQALVYPKRQGTVDKERRVATLNYVLYHKKGSEVYWNGSRLQPHSCHIGFNEGWSIGVDLKERGMHGESGKNTEQNLKKLDKGRICAYATLEEAGDAAIANFPGRPFEKLLTPLSRKEYYLIFNPEVYRQQSQVIEQLWDEIGRERGVQQH